jgi:DNA-binding transcriptional ArsR family regulator
MVRSAVADAVFHALSNPTRREVLEQLSVRPASVSELAARFDMQLPSFVQHLSVLERSRLVRSKKRGRVRTYEIAPERLAIVDDWLAARRQAWEARLDSRGVDLESLDDLDERQAKRSRRSERSVGRGDFGPIHPRSRAWLRSAWLGATIDIMMSIG